VRALADRVGGNDRQAHAAGHGLEDRLVAAEFEPHGGLEAALTEIIVGGQARARAALPGDEADVAEILQQHRRPARQTMLRGRDHDERVRHEGRRAQRQIGRRTRHDVEVVMVLPEAVDDAVAVEQDHRDVDARTGGAEGAEQTRREILGGVDHRDLEQPALAAAQRLDVLLEGVPLHLDAARGLGEFATGLGQEDLTTDHFIKRQADRFGEIAEVHRGRRLGDVCLFGRSADAAGGHQGSEKLELSKSDVHSICAIY